jgi:hypothetical protein
MPENGAVEVSDLSQAITMQSDQGSNPVSAEGPVQPAVAPALPADALARRRLLLKGLGRGSAAVAVMAPVQSLMAQSPVRLCTVSGVQSNVGSGRTGGTTEQCQGYSQGYFAVLANWPNYRKNPKRAINVADGRSFDQNSSFAFVFNDTSASTDSLITLIASGTASQKIWITALLNSIKRAGIPASQIGYFPYTATEVVGLYNDPAKRAAAEAFFTGYLEGVGA